jgi:hypothetical protein
MVGQPHRVEHQRGGFVARVVGAVTEEHSSAPQPPLDAGDEFARALAAPGVK